jgi:hypothetical protein
MTSTAFEGRWLAADLQRVHDIYAAFFSTVTDVNWDRPVKGSAHEWTLHETMAHLCGLIAVGQRGIQAALTDEPLSVPGLTNQFEFNQFNRQEIDARLALPRAALCQTLLEKLGQLIDVAQRLNAAELKRTATLPIYNRPVTIAETLGILMFHTGLHHSAQVAEPVGVPPLWHQLESEVRHRVITRVMRALSLLYRFDLGGDLRAAFAFRIGGEGGGDWAVRVAPDHAEALEGEVGPASLTIKLSNTDIFCQMFTGRLNLPLALLTGRLRLSGNLRLFPRFGSLFSVDARH